MPIGGLAGKPQDSYTLHTTYTLYRMSFNFGAENSDLTKAIRSLAKLATGSVAFTTHSEVEMDKDGFDHADALACLRKGIAYGPEIQNNELRANVVHRGLHIRVVVAGLEDLGGNWSSLTKIRVVTVMRAT